MIAKLKKVFLMVAGSAVQKYGTELEEHQQTLMAAADILIEIYMAESAILRTEKNAKRFGKDSQKEQIAMSQLYLYHAVDIITVKAKEAILSFAEGDEQRAMLMGLKRFTICQILVSCEERLPIKLFRKTTIRFKSINKLFLKPLQK